MDAITPEQVQIAMEAGWDMRVGRKLKRTLYLYEHTDGEKPYLRQQGMEAPGFCVGIVDSERIATLITDLWNENAMKIRRVISEEFGE